MAFFNELDSYANERAIRAHHRRSVSILAWAGYNNPPLAGGYCLPKDTKQLLANYSNVPQNLIQACGFIAQDAIGFDIIARQPGGGHLSARDEGGLNNFRDSSVQGIMSGQIRASAIVYEPVLAAEDFFGSSVSGLSALRLNRLIVANRATEELLDVLIGLHRGCSAVTELVSPKGLGYIGSHTAVALHEAGWRVVLLDNLANASRAVLDRLEASRVRPFPSMRPMCAIRTVKF